MKLKILRNLILMSCVLVIFFGLGYRLGLKDRSLAQSSVNITISGKTDPKGATVDFSLFWDVWDRVSHLFIDKKAIDPQKMIYGAIGGMVSSLGDPYTVFLPPDQNKEAKDDLGGKFEGIGAQLGIKDKKIIIVAPLKSSPAEASGLLAGDWIIRVDGKETYNWTLPETVSKIRGPKGSKVVLKIQHKDASRSADVSVSRDEIKVASVEWELKNIKCSQKGQKLIPTGITSQVACAEFKNNCPDCEIVIYLKLGRFGDNTDNEWDKTIDSIVGTISKIPKSTLKGLVFDLRNNPGGYLSGSVFIASEFLKDGTVVIQENYQGKQQNFTVNKKGRLFDIPMIVLINKGSASASEIVAGALKERKRVTLLGETTFGKGSIQEAQELPQGAGIHITTAKWLLPSGIWINGSGIEPDIKVENNTDRPDEDLQLDRAYETLLK